MRTVRHTPTTVLFRNHLCYWLSQHSKKRTENHTEAPAFPFLAPPSGRPRESQFNTVGGEDGGGLAGDCGRDCERD